MNINAVSPNFTGMLRIKKSESDRAINTNNIYYILTDRHYADDNHTNIYYLTLMCRWMKF